MRPNTWIAATALTLMLAGGILATTLAAERQRIEPLPLEGDRFTQAWFLNSFLILGEDLAAATAEGKRFAIFWDQRGCPYCMETHRVNLAEPDVNDYIRQRFNIVQLDMFGARSVTDIDGEVLTEKELARKYGITYTPTIQFFPESRNKLGGKKGRGLEVARMPGYFRPFHFLTMFEYVHERAYERETFQRYVRAKSDRFKAEGKDVNGL